MPSVDRIWAFSLVAAVLIAIPGPSVLFIVGRAVAAGRGVALATVWGNELGLLVQLAAVSVGVGAIVERSVAAFTVLKLAGAVYLVLLGLRALRSRPRPVEPAPGNRHDRAPASAIREGFIVGVTNPKALLIFTAIIPQFVAPGAGLAELQVFVLGCIAICIALASDSAWAVAAGTARAWLGRSPRRLAQLRIGGGLTMIGLGLHLALTSRRD